VKRTSAELQRDLAALIKHSEALRADANDLARAAAEIRRQAVQIQAEIDKAKRPKSN
jgi:hypothetical protein